MTTTKERFEEKFANTLVAWKASFPQHITDELLAFVESEKAIQREEGGRVIEEARKLLEACEPFLLDGSGVGVSTAVYIPPATQMRNRADAMERESDLKARVKAFLTPNHNG